MQGLMSGIATHGSITQSNPSETKLGKCRHDYYLLLNSYDVVFTQSSSRGACLSTCTFDFHSASCHAGNPRMLCIIAAGG